MSRLLATVSLSIWGCAAHADSVDGTWQILGFTGEAWFLDASLLVGQTLTIQGGLAEGPLYSCPFSGQSMTYTAYGNEAFFENPEFRLFGPLRDGMVLGSEKLFVHRITCDGGGDPSLRRVLYPFVTNEARSSAWYLYEGGVFELYRP